MDVRLPDGTVIRNVPDGTTRADLVGKLKTNGMAIPSEWLGADTAVPATDRQRLLSSPPMRLAKGMKDPMDGVAQFLESVTPKGLANAVNSAADFVGGEGTFLGDVLGIKSATSAQLTGDIKESDKEYADARKATGQDGVDLLRMAGNVVSPVNMTVAKMAPAIKGGETVKALAAKGAAAGAAGAATQPVMSDDFWAEKGRQAAIGAAGGAVLTPVITKAAGSIAKFVSDKFRNRSVTPEAIEYEIKASFARDDIDLANIPKEMLDQMTAEVSQAVKSGQKLDSAALMRKLDFARQGVRPMLGQVTRDPTQYTKELNLKGVQGVGEPIANRLNQQASIISGKFRQNAPNAYEAGQEFVDALKSKDKEMSGGVRAAYKAFKDSTGKDLEVPLQGLAQGYAKTLEDFGDTIPGSVRGQFEKLGLLTGKQLKLLSIDDAEGLIKTINKNYNPADKAQARALDELRGHVQDAILNVTDSGAGMEAATLANLARDTAKQRFDAIKSVPALKAAISGAEPDDFVQKFVIRGKVRELNELAKLVGPDGQKSMQQQMMRHLESKAFGANAAGDGAGSQAAFNRELNAIGRNKLAALFGPEKTDELYSLGRVMAYIQQRPAGSTVNESGTGGMIASMLGKMGGTIKGAPYINDFVVKPIQKFGERADVGNSLLARIPKQSTELDAETVNSLARLMGPLPVATGAALGYSVR